ncbi:MAG TPA: YtxH domain-containing protein [Patescibacteria group bacterium]|nr:YtxH domain-containing protein [Patescibacteria group bacterium]
MDTRMKETFMFVAGAALGASLVALLTPTRGDELRQNLREKLHHSKGKLSEATDEIEENLRDAR